MTWNCKQALDQKWSRLMDLAPDIATVQECASPAILGKRGVPLDGWSSLWASKSDAANARKGLGVFAAPGVILQPAPRWPEVIARWAEQPYRLDVLMPFEVLAPQRLNVLAVWSFNNRGQPGRAQMRGPVLVALDELGDWLQEAPSLVIGDFNNHPRWDRPRTQNTFARHIEELGGLGLRSAYHHLGGVAHGDEPVATHLWRAGMRYHIDYAFASGSLLDGAACSIAPMDAWCGPGGISDHVPLVLELPRR